MANMQMTKTPMPEQDPNVRNKNFKEVTLGYTAEMAINEAQRCMQCKKPKCVEGCPVNIRIPEFIAKVAEGDFAAAYEVITSTNALPALSGRVCPQLGRARQTRRAGADHGDLDAVGLRLLRHGVDILAVPVGDKALQTADGDRLTLDAADALGLALRFLRADTAGQSRQRVGLIK